VDQSVAGRLGSGGVSALVYGNKLASVLLAIVATAIATVVLPSFSRLAAARDWKGLRHSVLVYCGTVTLIMVPMAAILITASGFLVRTFFEHGAFRSAATQLVTEIQRFSLLQTPFTMLLAILTRLTAALSANALLVRVGIAALITDVVLDLLFSHWWGVPGIALATPVVQAVSLAVLAALLFKREPQLFRRGERG
jgi:putative peptidoglycan lipid II flippase